MIQQQLRPRKQYRCIRAPLGWNGGPLFRIKGVYVIFDDEPEFIYLLTVNGSIGKKQYIIDVPNLFSKYFKEI